MVARRSDFLENDSAEKEIVSALRRAKETVLNEKKAAMAEKKDKEVKTYEDKTKDAVVEKKDKEVKTYEEKENPRPNSGVGIDLENYSWQQTLKEVIILLPLPAGMSYENVDLSIKENHLKIGFHGQPPIIDGELFAPLIEDECYCCEDDHDTVYILLTKQNQLELWKSVIKGDPELFIPTFETLGPDFPDPDPETRREIKRIMVID
uniref:Nuclear migration protein nudC n=1 Tax=Cajanus cajan TaxID=3821 RepID=A0A151R1G9_CAJCA|nr:Nuclear migration protein nudC [Cajanus cajan]